jgi:hypothetical protein
MSVDPEKPEETVKRNYAIFTPKPRAIEIRLDNYSHNHLGRIFFIRAGQKIGGVVKIEKHRDEQFMEGVAASGVPQAAQVLELLKANQTIEVTFVEREEKL